MIFIGTVLLCTVNKSCNGQVFKQIKITKKFGLPIQSSSEESVDVFLRVWSFTCQYCCGNVIRNRIKIIIKQGRYINTNSPSNAEA